MRRTLRSLIFPLALVAVMPASAQAGLLVPTGSGRADGSVLAIREMDIEVGIARGYARVNVRQIFENRTASVQEGTYRFALPPSASVGDFAIWDGLQRIPGVILEKRRARAVYQELARQRIDPGLLQQGEDEQSGEDGTSGRPSGGAMFSVTVSPIPAYATKRLELQFQEETPFIAGLGEFRLVLRPPDGEPPVARKLAIHVHIEDGAFEGVPAGLPLSADGAGASFSGTDVKLDRDLVFRIRAKAGEPLALSAFRNPDGALPDGIALAPWERPSDVPPEKDGFFLLQAIPPGEDRKAAGPANPQADAARPGQVVVILFDTSLSHRWGGLETAYGDLVRVLQSLKGTDRFALIPYDRKPGDGAQLASPSPEAIEAALSGLRERPLGPGADVAGALAAARKLAGDKGRVLLLTSGMGAANSKALKAALGGAALFTAVTNGEAGESLRAASAQVLSPTATEIEGDLFFQRLLAADGTSVHAGAQASSTPFTMSGADPKLRDIYPVLIRPMAPGSLSGWVGRYAAPQLKVHVELVSALFPGGKQALDGALPEKALEARDLPRRWARARVDDLLARIERDGERREWVEEIIALSKRYKFVTPYTAFLAAPRSLLRPRRIQPGDPVLRVECDAGTVAATAFLPFGVKLDLVKRPQSSIWEGRFLVPEGLKDGRYPVRILIQDASGARVSETKHFILDGTAPEIRPTVPATARAGELVRITAKTDKDVVLLNARVGDAPPIPLRWDAAANCSVGLVRIPHGASGAQEVVFEAVDGAKNRGFARATMEVRP